MDNTIGVGYLKKLKDGSAYYVQLSVVLDDVRHQLLMFTNRNQEGSKPNFFIKRQVNGQYEICGSAWIISTSTQKFSSAILNLGGKKYHILIFKRFDYKQVLNVPGEHAYNVVLKNSKEEDN